MKDKFVITAIVSTLMAAISSCSTYKEAEILKERRMNANSLRQIEQTKILERRKDSLKLDEIIMNYDGKKEMVLYKTENRIYTLNFNPRSEKFVLNYTDSQDSLLQKQSSKISKFDEKLIENILYAKNNLGNQNRSLVEIMDSIVRDERLYKDNYLAYFKIKLKTFEPTPLGDGVLIKGPARDYVTKCVEATNSAINNARSNNDLTGQVTRLNELKEFLERKLYEKKSIIDMQNGVYTAKIVIKTYPKADANNSKSKNTNIKYNAIEKNITPKIETIDIIIVVTDYVANTTYGQYGTMQDAHKAAQKLLDEEIKKYTLQKIKKISAKNTPYKDITLSPILDENNQRTNLENRRAVLIYYEVGNSRLTKEIIKDLTPYNLAAP